MDVTPPARRELIELWLAACDGLATDSQLAQLNRQVETDPEARACLLRLARQQGWLAWNAAEARLPAVFAALSRAEDSMPLAVSSARTYAARQRAWTWLALAASIVGVSAGLWITSRDRLAKLADAEGAPIQATMVSSTGCVWGSGNALDSPAIRGVAGGDSLQLLEGIADFRIGVESSDVRLQMEGPASVVFSSQGAASMSYGKIVIKTGRLRSSWYAVETSFGRVLIEPEAELGLIGFGSKAEIHCFRGRIVVESPWLRSDDSDVASLPLAAGEALVFTDVGGATIRTRRSAAHEDRFTPQVSMNTDFLSVSPEYVRSVVAARPVAYWRFEESSAGLIRNEMGPAYEGHIMGEVGWTGPEGNRAIELGMNYRQGSIVANDSWDDVLTGDFSVELWMKPSHYHLGSMVGFVGEFDPAVRRNKHGVLLETCGPSNPSDWLRLKQVRFLHRSQLTAFGKDGVSCFSGEPYEPRRWQHIVAVKEGTQMRLYLDGKLVETAVDEAPTPKGLHMVIGQLYTETAERFFIGQLDEVAIYRRALSSQEVSAHHELLHPVSSEDPGVSAPAA